MPRLRGWVNANDSNRKIYQNFVDDTRAAFPHYLKEMEAMAESSGISMEDLLIRFPQTYGF